MRWIIIFLLIVGIAEGATINAIFNETTLVADTYVSKFSGGNDNFGTANPLFLRLSTAEQRMYFRWDLTNITGELTVNNASININDDGSGSCTNHLVTAAYHLIDDSWVETSIVWNDQPCGTAGAPGGSCNTTALDSHDMLEGSGWKSFDVKPILVRDFEKNESDRVISILIDVSGFSSCISQKFTSREGTDTLRAYLNVSYDTVEAGAPDSCTYGGSGDWYIDCCHNCTVNATDLVGNNIFINSSCGTQSGTTFINGLLTNWKEWKIFGRVGDFINVIYQIGRFI